MKIFLYFISKINLDFYSNLGKFKICFSNKVEKKINQSIYKKILVFIILLSSFQNQAVQALREPIIRVLIKKDTKLRVRSDSSIPLIIKGNRFFNKRIKGLTISNKLNKKVLFFDKQKDKFYKLNKESFLIRSSDRRGIWVGDKRYSGIINVTIKDDQIYVVNELGIEKYLNSVVGAEMPHKWPLEALKAQAIASRTYALKKKGNAMFDIDSTQRDQVYQGLESMTIKTQKAVRSTRSLVITYKNKLINALFHSSSGSKTENSEDVWSNKYDYLRSVKDFDKNNPKLTWEKSFSKDELRNFFPKIDGLENMKILRKSNTGRIKSLEIIGKNGSKEMLGKDFRGKLKLNSTLFNYSFINPNINGEVNSNQKLIDSSKTYLLISGKGSGHGVGMSQWGAKYMASKGARAEQILRHFYKDIKIKPFKKIYK